MTDAPLVTLESVFTLSGVPTVTFVPPVEYSRLSVALRTPGRGVVVEGPSGIGKTTAVTRALTELGSTAEVLTLSGRRAADRELIAELPGMASIGTVIIDDFHRLETNVRASIADYLKLLADEGRDDTKVVVVGINKAGESLITFGRDLKTRLDIVRLTKEPDDRVRKLLTLGETALNIQLTIADEIVEAANGSFNLAQMLCHDACLSDNVVVRAETHHIVNSSFALVNGRIMDRLSAGFAVQAAQFASGTKLRREGRAPYLHLLKWLSEADEWAINVEREMAQRPELKGSVGQVVKKGYLTDLLADEDKGLADLLHFDEGTKVLSIEDPQFYYFIRNQAWNKFAERVGYINVEFSSTYDFALSFAGAVRGVASALFDGLADRELEVFYDHNEQYRIPAENVEEYLDPIYRSEATFVVCLLSPEYPQRVWTKFESQAFKDRFGEGAVIPIWWKNAPPGMFDASAEVGGVEFDPEADARSQIDALVDLLCEKIADRRLRLAQEAQDHERDNAAE